MRRRILKNNGLGKETIQNLNDQHVYDFLIDIPENLKDYANRLSLLYDIPLTYLLTDVSDLPPESIRFGMVDKNWIDAYIDGAFSIGRVCDNDTWLDAKFRGKFNQEHKLTFFNTPRMQMMHPNHKALLPQKKPNNSENNGTEEKIEFISVVLIRSELIKNQKELHFSAYDSQSYDYVEEQPKAAPLYALRIEKISNDIMICLFSGILDVFIIDEPKTGLKYGGFRDKEGKINIDIRSIDENNPDNFGKSDNKDKMSISECIEESGKVNAAILAELIKSQLNPQKGTAPEGITMTPSIFAFEMLSVPHKAVFSSQSLGKNNPRKV